MEFNEAMQIWGRMCKASDSCQDCQLTRKCPLIGKPSDINSFEFEAIFAKWAAEHPVKTIADDFFEKHPKALKISSSGIPVTCAKFCGYCKHCVRDEDASNCEKCWSQPLEE